MKTLFENVCPMTINREFKECDEIIITANADLLNNTSNFVACVAVPASLAKAMTIFADGHRKKARTLAVNSSQVSLYIEAAIDTQTNINIVNKNTYINVTEIKTELEKQLLKAQHTDVRYISVDYIAKLLAANIPSKMNIVQAATTLLNTQPALDYATVFNAISAEVNAVRSRVQAIKSISAATVKVDSVDDIAEEIANKSGVYIVKTPTGSRKTSSVLEPLIKSAIENNEKPVFMAHRRSIIASAMNIEGILHYERILPGSEENINALKIVVNSTIKSNFEQYFLDSSVLVIDEANQTLDHVFTGSVDYKAETHAQLVQMIKTTRTVVLADADANDNLLELIAQAGRTDITIFEMHADHSDIEIQIKDANAMLVDINKAIKNNNRTLIAVDSIKKADKLADKMAKDFEDKRVLKITAKTVESLAQAAFLANPNQESVKYDVVIYSPVITSSVSITSDVFDRNFGIFTGVVAPSDAVQMLRRDRTARLFEVSVSENQNKNFNSATANEIISQYNLFDDAISQFDELSAKIDADKQFFKNNFSAAFIYNVELDKFNVSIHTATEQEIEEGRSIDVSATQIEKAAYTARILRAEPATQKEIMRAKSHGMEMTEEVAYRIERNAIEELICKNNLDADDVKLWKRGTLAKHIANIELALATVESVEIAQQNDEMLVKRERKHVAIRHNFYTTILHMLNLDLHAQTGDFSVQNAQDVLAYIYKNKRDWAILGHTNATAKWLKSTQATRIVTSILKDIFGMKTTSRSKMTDGIRERIYSLDSNQSVVEVLNRRIENNAIRFQLNIANKKAA